MSSYTTKWLPVEGEIKKEDYYFFKNEPSNILQRTTSRDLTLLQNNLQKVKLFLISYDIKIGDLAFVPNEEEAGTVSDGEDLKYWKSKNSYKMIGEISPDALSYVKANEKYNKEDLCSFLAAGFGSGTQKHVLPFEEKEGQNKLYVGVLGPCGHFH